MASEEPVRDILDDDTLLRRCPGVVPSFVTALDLSNGAVKIQRGALQLKENEDGISVYLECLLKTRDMNAEDVQYKPDQFVFAFKSAVVRNAGWDAVHSPDEDDRINFAHALVLHASMPFESKIERTSCLDKLRALIMGSAIAVVGPAIGLTS